MVERDGLCRRGPRWRSAPPPDLRSSFRTTYNLAVNLASRFDRETANDVLRRSFAQWQAERADLLTIQLSHRVAVLEQLGYLNGWTLSPTGHRLSRIYHESDPVDRSPRRWPPTS